MMQKNLVFAALLLFVSSAFAVDPVKQADRQNIDTACTAEAAAANCGSEKVGTGLLKCIGHARKQNHAFAVSPGCQTAINQLKTDKAAGK